MWFVDIFKQTLMITAFVLVVMLVIEYINTQSQGTWSKPFQKSKFLQIVFASFMGITPGCLGTYTVVSLYTHNIVNFGALVAALIATSGDEAFLMLSLFPETAIWLHLGLFSIAVVSGLVVNLFIRKNNLDETQEAHFQIHHKHIECKPYQPKIIIEQLKNITFLRTVLMFVLGLFIFSLLFTDEHGGTHEHSEKLEVVDNKQLHDAHDEHEGHEHEAINIQKEKATVLFGNNHEHPKWITFSFGLLAFFAFFIVSTVSEHFLEHHIWKHVIKSHFLKIFLWTLGALLFVHYIEEFIDIESWVQNNMFLILVAAVVIGFIPESGPHMIFVSMFVAGTIPLSILLASSISQDGHGALPLLAESKKSFVVAKLINGVIALVVGYIGITFF